MIRCIIVDDEEMSRRAIEQMVKRVEDLSLAAVCRDGVEAAAVLRKEKVDLVFLDVEMPEMTGIELIRSLARKPEVVLITSKEEYAVEAFEYDVADYIVKPAMLDRFLRAVDRVRQRLRMDDAGTAHEGSVFVKVDGQRVKVRTADIQWIEALGDYVNLHTENDTYTIHTTMKALENALPADQFLRVHRSFIVRLDRIKSIQDSVIVIGRKLIPVGDSHRPVLNKRLTML